MDGYIGNRVMDFDYVTVSFEQKGGMGGLDSHSTAMTVMLARQTKDETWIR